MFLSWVTCRLEYLLNEGVLFESVYIRVCVPYMDKIYEAIYIYFQIQFYGTIHVHNKLSIIVLSCLRTISLNFLLILSF